MSWSQKASLKGPQGDDGREVELRLNGFVLEWRYVGAAGWSSLGDLQGPPGADGAGIQLAGEAATYAQLPAGLGAADAGKGYLVRADGKLYIWSGSAFPASGAGVAFQGPAGSNGREVELSVTGGYIVWRYVGTTVWINLIQLEALRGPAGEDGAAGARGSRIFNGSGAPGAVATAAPGDYYLDNNTGILYELS